MTAADRTRQALLGSTTRKAAAAAGVALALALLVATWLRAPRAPSGHPGTRVATPATPATPSAPAAPSRVDRLASADLAARPKDDRLGQPASGDLAPPAARESAAPRPPEATSGSQPPAEPAPGTPPGGSVQPRQLSGQTAGARAGNDAAPPRRVPEALPAAPGPAEPSLIPENPQGSYRPPAAGSAAPSAALPELPPPAPSEPSIWLRPRPRPADRESQPAVEPPVTDVEGPPPGLAPIPSIASITDGSAGQPGHAGDGALAAGAAGGGAPLPSEGGPEASPPARRAWPSAAPSAATAPSVASLSGAWEVHNVVNSTSYPSYRGLRLTYHVTLRREGTRIVGDGEKWAENDRRIPASRRTPIHLDGEVVGRELRVEFTEQGSERDSSGSFRWRLSPDGRSLAGTFASTAAGSRGISAAYRLP